MWVTWSVMWMYVFWVMLLSVPVYWNLYRGLYYFKLSPHRFCLRVYKSVYPAQFSKSSLLPDLLRASEEPSDKTQPAVRCHTFSRQPQRTLETRAALVEGRHYQFPLQLWEYFEVCQDPQISGEAFTGASTRIFWYSEGKTTFLGDNMQKSEKEPSIELFIKVSLFFSLWLARESFNIGWRMCYLKSQDLTWPLHTLLSKWKNKDKQRSHMWINCSLISAVKEQRSSVC